jgi:hypothetical protein
MVEGRPGSVTMTKKRTIFILLCGMALLAVAILGVALFAPASNTKFVNATAALAFITGAAVAIERSIEASWTALGGTLGTYWPLNWVRDQARALTDALDGMLGPVRAQMEQVLQKVEGQTDLAVAQVSRVNTELQALSARIKELETMAPDNQRLQMVVNAAAQQLDGLQKAYGKESPELNRVLETAKASINGMQEFLGSFSDNPGRRLISLFVGATLGVVLAGVFGLDVFQAVMETGVERDVGRVIFTGLMIGLGSSPTHEVIRAIQEYKKNRKGDTAAK